MTPVTMAWPDEGASLPLGGVLGSTVGAPLPGGFDGGLFVGAVAVGSAGVELGATDGWFEADASVERGLDVGSGAVDTGTTTMSEPLAAVDLVTTAISDWLGERRTDWGAWPRLSRVEFLVFRGAHASRASAQTSSTLAWRSS